MKALKNDRDYMRQCLELAALGKVAVAPNPMVGAIVVKNGEVIGKGYHKAFGMAHAEVSALEDVKDKNAIRGATIFVNLEPCVHHGKTPPCCDRIIESGISRVVIAGIDPNARVNGQGVDRLRKAGLEVVTGILEEKEETLNVRFRTFHKEQRPYVILKWAQSADGFLDIDRSDGSRGSHMISGPESQLLVHQWRSEESAILVGTNTALIDDPSLTVRLVEGRNPIRCVMDLKGRLPGDLKLFNDGMRTILYTGQDRSLPSTVNVVKVDIEKPVLDQILRDLYHQQVQSLIVEGGQALLKSFIIAKRWDEARVFTSPQKLLKGLASPKLLVEPISEETVGSDRLSLYQARR